LRYVQSGSPVVTKLDLTNFYAFADALDNALINSAELVINNVASPETANAHNVLGLRILGDDNQFQNVGDTLVRKALSSYNVITVNGYNELTNGRYYMVNSDVSSAQRPVIASIAYSSDNKSYSGFMTFFVQSLFNNRKTTEGTNTTRIQHLALYPLSPSPLSSVTRTVFHKDDVKLRIFYTQPTQLNP
jgi:hypothetical protein